MGSIPKLHQDLSKQGVRCDNSRQLAKSEDKKHTKKVGRGECTQLFSSVLKLLVVFSYRKKYCYQVSK